MNTLVSIIIPCYNQAHYLPDALESVLAQKYPEWECIIVNDGSRDQTEAVAIEWVAGDKRFTYILKENGGLSSTRNRGLQAATGRYIQFLDADDVIDEEKLSLQVLQLPETQNLALSYCDYFPSTERNLKELYTSWYLNHKFKSNQNKFISQA